LVFCSAECRPRNSVLVLLSKYERTIHMWGQREPCPGAATSSGFPFAHMHVHVTDDERFDDMGGHIGAVRREADFPTVVCSA